MISSLKQARNGAFQRGAAFGHWWEKQAWPVRLYSAGVLVALAAFICGLFGITYRGVHTTIFVLGTMLLAIGLVLEGYRLVDQGLATRLGMVVAALATTMIGAMSMAISSVIVNEATGFPPSEFPYTVTFLAPLTAGYILVLVTIVAFVVVPLVILIAGLVSMWPLHRRDRRETDRISVQTVVRLVAAVTLCLLILAGWDKQHRPYEQSLESLAGWFAYTFEMYGNDSCARGDGERVRRMGDIALVGQQQEAARIFHTRQCVQGREE